MPVVPTPLPSLTPVLKPVLIELPMPILTPRLQIRPRQIGEGEVLARAVTESLNHLRPWMPFAQVQPSVEQMEEHARVSVASYILRTNMTLSIYDVSGENLIGSTGLHEPRWEIPAFHIGYWVHEKYAGKGYVAEAANALTRYAFSALKARRVEIRCDSRNSRSLAVMKRLGYVQEGVLRLDDLAPDGTLRDTIVTARYDIEGLPPLEVRW